MSNPVKKWTMRPRPEESEVEGLSKSINVSSELATLLINRNIKDYETAETFFNPKMSTLLDPFLMKDMRAAVDRIVKAIDNKENILVYGDYDVDGTTSVALVYSVLSGLTETVSFYIPDRYKEGYGVSYRGIDYAADNDFSLIITLDCGIKAIEKVEYATAKGVDVIICDHHRPGEQIPKAVAVLDPKRADCHYPYKELCGCGVGYKLMKALSVALNLDDEQVDCHLDLVALAIGADIVPITGENRVLMHFGIQRVNDQPSKGISALKKVAQIQKRMTVTDLVFTIAPRINAAGRIKSGSDAVALLTAEDEEQIESLAQEVDRHNKERRELDKLTTAQALEMLQAEPDGKSTSVVYNGGWHKGVVGIVASRLTEHYYRPTIVLTGNEDKVTGSARSVKHFDVYEAINACSDLLVNFGGHKYAAGLTMEKDKLPLFKERFEKVVSDTLDRSLLSPELMIDIELPLSRISDKFYQIIQRMAPFGPQNMRPVFVAHNCYNFRGGSKVLKEKHLRVVACQKGELEVPMNGIAFGLGEKIELVESGKPFSIAFVIEENTWNGQTTLQLMVRDIRPTADVTN